jgi:hypothetical protein
MSHAHCRGIVWTLIPCNLAPRNYGQPVSIGGPCEVYVNDWSCLQCQTREKYVCPDRRTPMPRRVELVSGAYLDYYYHCTVIVVSWYAPCGDLRGGAFLGLAHFGILERGVLAFSTLARVWGLHF